MKIETLLHEEIQDEFESLKQIEIGTDEYKATVDGLAKLMDRAIEIDRFNSESEDKTRQMEEDNKDRMVRNSIAVAGIVIPTFVTIWGTVKTLKFEESGTITTNAGRSFINRLFKK